jgi:hypothetical protein
LGGPKPFDEARSVDNNTDDAQFFGKNGREVLSIKIRSNAPDFVKPRDAPARALRCRVIPSEQRFGAVLSFASPQVFDLEAFCLMSWHECLGLMSWHGGLRPRRKD